MPDALALISGLTLAAVGGELFVRGAVGLAVWARVPAGIVGATVVAFATSSPELSVSISAATAGRPQIALGDALGSNVANIGLVLGLTAMVGAITTRRSSIRRDFPVALAAPVGTALLAVDGTVSRLDAMVLLAGFAAWLVLVVRDARRARRATGAVQGDQGRWRALRDTAGGLVCLVAAGQLIVSAAAGIGASLGMDPFVVGATLVAIGTSTPELATALLARLRGLDEVGLGTLLGSNLFNGLFIVAVAALIAPITVPWSEVGIGLTAGVVTVLVALPSRVGLITRRRGAVLLVLYVGYVVALLGFAPAVG